jgi:hypothetical protein
LAGIESGRVYAPSAGKTLPEIFLPALSTSSGSGASCHHGNETVMIDGQSARTGNVAIAIFDR